MRLAADAPGLERPSSDLIAFYLSPGRLPAGRPWSRKHADTQRRLCARYLAPVIAGLACEDIKTVHMQAAVNAAPTAKEGARVPGGEAGDAARKACRHWASYPSPRTAW